MARPEPAAASPARGLAWGRAGLVVLVLVIGLLALALYGVGQGQSPLSLARLWQATFLQAVATSPVLTTLAYGLVFVLITALCLPGAGVLLLMAGAGFGLVWGSVLGVLASSLGATLTMLAVRRWIAPPIEARFAQRLPALREALRRDGAWLLFSLRLAPVIPFVPLNLMAGATPLPIWTFFWVSTLGMLPSTVVWVQAGAQLATVNRLDQIFSPALLGSLLLLALLPWLGRGAVAAWARLRQRSGEALRSFPVEPR